MPYSISAQSWEEIGEKRNNEKQAIIDDETGEANTHKLMRKFSTK